ncbi:MAG: MauE/DoxX family redox-associated membrane protein [Candidatus Krumholzibacteriia bacterium]
MSRWRDALSLLCRLGVGAVFLYACIDKLAHPAAFAQNIANYRLVPMALLHPFAWLMPVAEAVVAVALICGWQRRGALILAAAMLLVFMVAIAAALIRNLDISCGCFDTGNGHAVGRDLLIRDVVLLLVALLPFALRSDRWSLDAARRHER